MAGEQDIDGVDADLATAVGLVALGVELDGDVATEIDAILDEIGA